MGDRASTQSSPAMGTVPSNMNMFKKNVSSF